MKIFDEVLLATSRPPSSNFPSLNRNENEIISQIIQLTPSNTSAFNVLISPYETTLRRHRIDPTTDDKYYTYLLKLSLVSGVDWKQKWERAIRESSSGKINSNPTVPVAIPNNPHPTYNQQAYKDLSSRQGPSAPWTKLPSNTYPTKPDPRHTRPPRSVHFLPLKDEEVIIRKPSEEVTPVAIGLEVVPSGISKLVDYSDVKARRFRRGRLLSRFIKKWTNSIITWNSLGSEAESARQILDVSRFYQVWHRKSLIRLNKSKSAINSYNNRLLFSHLDHWRRLTILKKEQKWLSNIKSAFRRIHRVKEENLCRLVLTVCLSHLSRWSAWP